MIELNIYNYSHQIFCDGREVRLSIGEWELLTKVAECKKIKNTELSYSKDSVRVFISNITRKVGCRVIQSHMNVVSVVDNVRIRVFN